MGEEEKICCCDSQGWTRVIGWTQLTINLGLYIIFLFAIIIEDLADGKDDITYSGSEYRKTEFEKLYAIVFVSTFTLLIVGLVMALTLLTGSIKRKPKYIMLWMLFTGLCVTVTGVGCAYKTLYMDSSGSSSIGNIVSFAVYATIHFFLMWVVNKHRSDMIEEEDDAD